MLSYVALAISVIGALFAVFSLALHWFRGQEHPDVTQLRTNMADLLDKVEQWMRRDRVRRLRESHEEPDAPPAQPTPDPTDVRAVKAALRAKVFGRR